MDMMIRREELLATVKRAVTITPSHPPIKVLQGVLIEADSSTGSVTVTSTNLEVTLIERLSGSVQESGAFVLQSSLLFEILRQTTSEQVTFRIVGENKSVTIESEDTRYQLAIWTWGDFPKSELPFPEDTVKVTGVSKLVQNTVFATVSDREKPLLGCVNLMFTGNGLRAVGSDGSCMVSAKGDSRSIGNVSMLVPATSFEKLAQICRDEDELRVGTTGRCIVFFKENLLFSIRLMEGGYIDSDAVLKNIQNSFTVLTDIQELKKALTAVLALEEQARVKLSFRERYVEFSCEGALGNATVPVEVVPLMGAPQGEYWFATRQLYNCLRTLRGTATVGIAQGGLLTLEGENVFYMQNATRVAPVKQITAKAA